MTQARETRTDIFEKLWMRLREEYRTVGDESGRQRSTE